VTRLKLKENYERVEHKNTRLIRAEGTRRGKTNGRVFTQEANRDGSAGEDISLSPNVPPSKECLPTRPDGKAARGADTLSIARRGGNDS
jgi:hypothetical protein